MKLMRCNGKPRKSVHNRICARLAFMLMLAACVAVGWHTVHSLDYTFITMAFMLRGERKKALFADVFHSISLSLARSPLIV